MSEVPKPSLSEADWQRIDAYLHDLLPPEEAERFEQECERRPELRAALGRVGQRWHQVQQLPPEEPSSELLSRTLDQVRRRSRRRLQWRLAYAGASLFLSVAAALALFLMDRHYASLAPSPWNLEVLGQVRWLPDSDASLRVRLTRRDTGTAVSGVPVTIRLEGSGENQPPLTLAAFQTDGQGTGQPRFRSPDWQDGSYRLRVVAELPDGPEEIEVPIWLKRSWKLMLSSDKPVYQPGQTIRMRALALRRPDLRPVAGQEAVFRVRDPKGTVIFKRTTTTSRFGIASADCELAAEVLLGSYRITCEVGDSRSETVVEVARYVLPRFRLNLALDQPYYQPGQTVRGSVAAQYFHGAPVAGIAEIEVLTSDVKAAGWRRFEVRLDREGRADFEFRLPDKLFGRDSDGGDARFDVVAQVTDTAGQRQQGRIARMVTVQPLRVVLVPENGVLVFGVANRIYALASYADGRPARAARLTISGLPQELTTDDRGLAAWELTPVQQEIELTVTARDAAGLQHTQTHRLACGHFPGSDFLLRTDRAVYDAGQSLHLTVLGSGVEPVFVDLIRDGQTLWTTVIEVQNGHGEAVLDLPQDWFGTLDLVAYRYGPDGLPLRKQRPLYVRPARELRITPVVNQDDLRPGQRVKLTLELADAQGEPQPGAISLAAVDEAVFHVLHQAPGMEKTFFTLEQERLRPLYAIYPWHPDLDRQPGPAVADFEQALFAGLFQTERDAPRADRQVAVSFQDGASAPFAPFSLQADTYSAKQEEVEQRQYYGQRQVAMLWAGYFLAVAVLLYAAIWIYLRPLWILLAHAGLLIAVVSLSGLFLMTLAGGCGAKADRLTMLNGVGAMKAEELPTGREPSAAAPEGSQGSQAAPRVREHFPETLLWLPELVTDDNGLVEVEVDLADSITTWRLSAGAVTADGRLGTMQSSLRVFQPFFVDCNLPLALTRGDEVSVPVVISNYLGEEQEVEVQLQQEAWFELLEASPQQRLRVGANAVASVSFRIRATRVGTHSLQVRAASRFARDAVRRSIEVLPDGRLVEKVVNGSLDQPAALELSLPEDAIPGSGKLLVKFYPSAMSQLVEGLEGIFRQPYGCFEQTSSVTYPNVLALRYLRQTGRSLPEVEAKARQYIHLGCQRLLSFEVPGGGFEWFGNPPADLILTAYGLMEFQDLAEVYDLDPALLERTRQWLLKRRKPDGSWTPSERWLLEIRGWADQSLWRYLTTAYVAWAVFGSGRPDPSLGEQAVPTRTYLLARSPREFEDAYALALACNALRATGASPETLEPYLARLASMLQESAEGQSAFWAMPPQMRTLFFAQGDFAHVETTALAVLALLPAAEHGQSVQAGLRWLASQRRPDGTFGSTQGTILALKALLAAAGKSSQQASARHIVLTLGETQKTLTIPPEQDEVVQLVDLSEQLRTGSNRLALRDDTGRGGPYQVVFRYHSPAPPEPQAREPLSIALHYDRPQLQVGDTVHVEAVIVNHTPSDAPMVLLDLPIPAGFAVFPEDWTEMVESGRIAKFQTTARSIVVYLRKLPPEEPLRLRYRLRATLPVQATVPGARVYEYYNASMSGSGQAVTLVVR
jgi:hypothetical protein